MHLEFQLTFADFREAQEAHAVAAARATSSMKFVGLGWQMGTFVLCLLVASYFNPWEKPQRAHEWLIVGFVLPSLPWLAILAYTLWFQLRSAREGAAFVPPWQRATVAGVRPIKSRVHSKTLRAGLIMVTLALVFLVIAVRQHFYSAERSNDVFPLIYAMTFLPWGLYILQASALRRGLADRQMHLQWQRQTQLHELEEFEFDHAQVVQTRPHLRAELKWPGIAGLQETPNLFLLYRSPVMFHIIPKRSLPNSEMIDRFRDMVTALAGKQPSAFPVTVLTASAPISPISVGGPVSQSAAPTNVEANKRVE